MKRKNTGTAFEEAIAAQCAIYEAQGIAKIERTYIPSKYVFNKGKLQLVPIKGKGKVYANPWMDFFGFQFLPEKRCVVIECKDIDEGRLAINQERSGLKPSEYDAIKKWLNIHVVVLILWYRQSCRECRLFDGEYIRDTYNAGNKSVRWDVGTLVKNYDFLEALDK